MRFLRRPTVRLTLIIAAVLALVTGCGGQGAGTQQSSGTVRLVTWANVADLERLKTSLARFSEESGIDVEVVPVPSANYGQKINAQISSKTLPEIFWCTHLFGSPLGLGEEGILYDWAEYEKGTAPGAKDTGLDFGKFGPGLLDLYRGSEGQLYGIPNEVNTYGYFYNAEIFREAGLPVPSADWTWDDLYTAAEKLTVKSANGRTTRYGLQTAWGLMSSPIGVSMYAVSNGGKSLAPQPNWIGVTELSTDPAFVEGARRLSEGIKHGYITGPEYQVPNAVGAFANGDIPLLHAGQWEATAFFQNDPGFEWGFAPLPRGTAGQVAPAESNAFCSPKELKDPEATYRVISFLLTEGFNEMYRESAIAPIAYLPGSQGYFENLASQGPAGQNVRATVELELNNPNKLGTYFLDPWTAKAGDLGTKLWNPTISGKKPLEPGLDEWRDAMNKVIANHG